MIDLVNPILAMIILLIFATILSVKHRNKHKLWKLFDLIWITLAPLSTFIFLYSYSINEIKLASQNAFTDLKYEAKYVIGTIDRHRNYLKCDQGKYYCESLELMKQFILKKSEKVERISLQTLIGMYSVIVADSEDTCVGDSLAENCEYEYFRKAMLSESIAQCSTAFNEEVLSDVNNACFAEPNKIQMFGEIKEYLTSYNSMVDNVKSRIQKRDILPEEQIEVLMIKIRISQWVSGILILIAFPFRFSKSVGELAAQYN